MQFAVPRAAILLLLLTLTACAVGDVQRTPNPPITLAAPPPIVEEGTCDQSDDLEGWSQAAYFQTTAIRDIVNAVGSRARADVYDDVLRLQEIRNDMVSRPTPDCALQVQMFLADVMDEATKALQSYANGDLDSFGTVLPRINARIEQAVTLENNLIVRLSNEFRRPTPTTSADGPAGG